MKFRYYLNDFDIQSMTLIKWYEFNMINLKNHLEEIVLFIHVLQPLFRSSEEC